MQEIGSAKQFMFNTANIVIIFVIPCFCGNLLRIKKRMVNSGCIT